LNVDLDNSYDAGYPGKGAALVLSGTDVYDADVIGETPDMLGSNADGSDGGCFVEVKILESGGNKVPYRYSFGETPQQAEGALEDYSDVWFANGGKSNYVHVVGANHATWAGDGRLGWSHLDANCSFTFVGELDYEELAAVANPKVTAHELAHQFELTNTDVDHLDVWCHLGENTERCVMDTTEAHGADPENGITELCHDGTDHLLEVRDWYDDL